MRRRRRDSRRGEPVAIQALDRHLGPHGARALVEVGAADLEDGSVSARFTILGAGRVLAVLPPQSPDAGDVVYLGTDSFWLLRRAWRLAAGGRRAVELGTGTGYLAAALAPRYGLTIGTDVLPATVAAAALTFRLNQPPGGILAALAADVGQGLPTQSFDLVVTNAPWVPGAPPDSEGRPRTFADGGPTGQELPARFIVEGAALLAPGGVAVTQCLDLTYDSGARPLAALCDDLVAEGFAASINPVGPAEISEAFSRRLREAGAPVTAMLVDVVVERPTTRHL